MTSKQAQKGASFERLIVDYLRSHGYRVDRTRAGWSDDRGDIHGTPGFTWECKNHRSADLAGWVRELDIECENNGTSIGAVVHKRRGITDPGEQYCTMPLRMLVMLLQKAGIK